MQLANGNVGADLLALTMAMPDFDQDFEKTRLIKNQAAASRNTFSD